MKKGVVICVLILLLILPLAIAAVGDSCTDNDDCDSGEVCNSDDECEEESTDNGDTSITTDTTDEDDAKADAYKCLEDKVEDKCSKLSMEEKIFTLLALDECADEITDDKKFESDLTATAKAVFALEEKSSKDTDDAKDWLLAQEETPSNIDWFLEIDTQEASSCKITYDSKSNTINIDADRKISGGGGSCLSSAQGGYWMRVSQNCYDKEFEITCDKSFLTTLLYKKKTSSTIYVSGESHTAVSEGTTSEKVRSSCFGESGKCDYEGSLWATLALESLDEDTSSYLPYLIVMSEDNDDFLPEAFLYLLTDYTDFYSKLLLRQKGDGYWDESGEKFYDTALALMTLYYESSTEKTNSINWLLEVQGKDGCWNSGNIRDTAFIIYALWEGKTKTTTTTSDCDDMGGHCMSSISCKDASGSELDYFCAGAFVCCSKDKAGETCAEQGGTICNSNEVCSGSELSASGLQFGQTCCSLGICQEEQPPQQSGCESAGGTCRASGCSDDEEEITGDCEWSTDSCCKDKTTPDKTGIPWWIWVLILLIILVIVGIVFKDKLRPSWFRIKSGFGKGKPGPAQRGPGPRPGFPGMPAAMPQARPTPRRILPTQSRRAPGRPRQPGRPKQQPTEFDDVLKKLKDMGK